MSSGCPSFMAAHLPSRTPFISLSEHIDYSTPEGMLQLMILAAFAAYFSDMLSKHTSKGKGERAAQGLYNGDIPPLAIALRGQSRRQSLIPTSSLGCA